MGFYSRTHEVEDCLMISQNFLISEILDSKINLDFSIKWNQWKILLNIFFNSCQSPIILLSSDSHWILSVLFLQHTLLCIVIVHDYVSFLQVGIVILRGQEFNFLNVSSFTQYIKLCAKHIFAKKCIGVQLHSKCLTD